MRWIRAALIALAWQAIAWPGAAGAEAPSPLTLLRTIKTLDNAQASQKLPVEFEATVTYYRAYDHSTFVQDGDVAIYVLAPPGAHLLAGDRVLVRGTTRASFRPFVVAGEISLLYHNIPPQPVPATFDEMIRARYDCQLVKVRGVVRSSDMELLSGATELSGNLQILTDGGYVEASVDLGSAEAVPDLLDAEVEVIGVNAGKFDGKMQQTGAKLHVSAISDIKVLKPARESLDSLPVTPMDEIASRYLVLDLTQRIRVRGTITYTQPGSAVVLQSGDRSLWIATRSLAPLRVGDLADATGFPDVHDGALSLTRSEVQDTHIPVPITPRPTTWEQMTLRGNDLRDHTFDLVSIEGVVRTEEREALQDEYVLFSGGHMFSAIYRHPAETAHEHLTPMRVFPAGTRVRLSGICIVENFDASYNHVPFDILLGSVDDIKVIAEPSWLSVRNLSYMVSALLLVVMVSGAWGWSLKRKVRRQTRAMDVRVAAEAAQERQLTQLEQRRSRILEDITGSQSLPNILIEVTELVSFRLNGVPCWCERTEGASLGNQPLQMAGFRIVGKEFASGSGRVLGALYAALSPLNPPSDRESAALASGARLATLAIENRRLYADLLHRSEHDLLTDIPNRFSMERQLDRLMLDADRQGTRFGLIYIDLDRFKQVNDLHGHHTGDRYLQEAVQRMKLQLRGKDMLARVGGDEFVALVPLARDRADAEQIVLRLEHCFDQPFELPDCRLRASASMGLAVYPQDGATREELQHTADTAMYLSKEAKRRRLELDEVNDRVWSGELLR